VVIQHLFEGGTEVPVVLPSHGNAKHQFAPYHRTQSSSLNILKQATGKPKVVVMCIKAV